MNALHKVGSNTNKKKFLIFVHIWLKTMTFTCDTYNSIQLNSISKWLPLFLILFKRIKSTNRPLNYVFARISCVHTCWTIFILVILGVSQFGSWFPCSHSLDFSIALPLTHVLTCVWVFLLLLLSLIDRLQPFNKNNEWHTIQKMMMMMMINTTIYEAINQQNRRFSQRMHRSISWNSFLFILNAIKAHMHFG